MAAVSVQPSPRSLSVMGNGRIPLSANQNAINSAFSGFAPVSGKRTRAHVETTKETASGLPASKKLATDLENDENFPPRSFARQSTAQRDAESRLFDRKSTTPVTAFERKLMAAREGKSIPQPQLSPDGAHKPADSLDNIRQWQRHYRKAFPTYVFYFESVQDDVRQKMSRLVQSLGAREEKFFSRTVTHVVTTRSIPQSNSRLQNSHDFPDIDSNNQGQRTIDPALLDRRENDSLNDAMRRTTDLLDSTLQARAKASHQPADILTKAKELDIKIWALEKLQRMMSTMFNTETGEQPIPQLSRSHATANLIQKQSKAADLQRLLRNEKAIGPADRDVTLPSQDMVQLRGNYIYIHDVEERTRPVMVRDFPKVASKDAGKWPQFRLSSIGRCPFVEDSTYARKKTQLREAEKAAAAAPRTRTRAAAEVNTVLSERQANANQLPWKRSVVEPAKPLDPPKLPLSRTGSTDTIPPMFTSAQANLRATRYIGGEPIASGVQQSNVTSAIRSQIVSSTAISSTAPGGMRVGTSKDLHALKRKVLQRGATVNSGQTLTSSYMNDVRAALNADSHPAAGRGLKRRAQDTLGNIREEAGGDEDEAHARKAKQTRRTTKAVMAKDPKPGYCENCRDKFDDFDEHILSRKHRKFALSQDNWAILDELLVKLVRPLKV